jgi:hypothetical protein
MTRDEIRQWLMEYVADHYGISPEEVESDRSLAAYGFEAEDLAKLVGAIEEYFEESLEGDPIRPRSTVASVTRYLCELTGSDDEEVSESEESTRDVDMEELARDIGLQ